MEKFKRISIFYKYDILKKEVETVKERCRLDMRTKDHSIERIAPFKHPYVHTTFKETGAIVSVTVREEKQHGSINLAIGQQDAAGQMVLQQEIFGIVKK